MTSDPHFSTSCFGLSFPAHCTEEYPPPHPPRMPHVPGNGAEKEPHLPSVVRSRVYAPGKPTEASTMSLHPSLEDEAGSGAEWVFRCWGGGYPKAPEEFQMEVDSDLPPVELASHLWSGVLARTK